VIRTLVLASASPRRRELLSRLGVAFTVRPADLDERPHPGEGPRALVGRLARAKADAVTDPARPPEVVLAADTIVDVDGDILSKPADRDEAAAMLGRLSGRQHRVHTGVAVGPAQIVVSTTVRFVPLDRADIDWYVATGEADDKAGAYAVQGIGGAFVADVHGSWSNVVGLPLAETVALLRAAGVAVLGRPATG
jgi:septum formation protein